MLTPPLAPEGGFHCIGEFDAAVRAYGQSGSRAELLAASAVLKKSGSWKDPRARGPWEQAAAAVVESSRREHWSERQRCDLLALAADLLQGPRLRVRGILPERILEGLVSRRLE